MKLAIREYWQNLKTEYETTYKVSIFSDYNVLKEYIECFKTYLNGLLHEHPHDLNIVCALATVEQVLRHEENSIQLLEEFLRKYKIEQRYELGKTFLEWLKIGLQNKAFIKNNPDLDRELFLNYITELGQKKGWFVDEIDWSLDLDK